MEFVQAIKRAMQLSRKGDKIAVLPPHGGLPSRIAVVKPGLWISILIDTEIESPGFAITVADLQGALKGSKPLSWILHRTLGIPIKLAFTSVLAQQQVPVVPLTQLNEWAPPFPATELKPFEGVEHILSVLHATVEDELRPEFGCVALASDGTYAGDEAQLTRAPPVKCAGLGLGLGPAMLVQADAFQKWPTWGHFYAYHANQRLYFWNGDELRVVALPQLTWWPAALAHGLLEAPKSCAVFHVPRSALIEPFKVAKRIAERRLVAIGYSRTPAEHRVWMRIGEIVTWLPKSYSAFYASDLPSHQVVLDGCRLLEILKALEGDEVQLELPDNPRSPVRFARLVPPIASCHAFEGTTVEALWPLLDHEKGP